MKNTRLSKFQKWLLCQAYENMIGKGRNNPADAQINKYEIYRDYYKLDCHTGKSGYNIKAFFDESKKAKVKVAALSRSLRNLFSKGFVLDPKGFFVIILSEQGIRKAREILSRT